MRDVSSSQNLLTLKKRSGLPSKKRVNRVPAVKASPNSTGPPEFCENNCLTFRSNRRFGMPVVVIAEFSSDKGVPGCIQMGPLIPQLILQFFRRLP